jgi:hypothetical protein
LLFGLERKNPKYHDRFEQSCLSHSSTCDFALEGSREQRMTGQAAWISERMVTQDAMSAGKQYEVRTHLILAAPPSRRYPTLVPFALSVHTF